MNADAPPDYARLIDAETWAFIRATEGWYPPETASYSIADQRAVYDRMCAAYDAPYPSGVTATDRPVAGVPCRHYTAGGPAAATVIYVHGGGFVVGGLHSHDAVCADICGATGLPVIAVDYRLSPEHLHPAAFEDALAVVRAVAAGGASRIVLAGDSAGGNLAAAVAHATRGEDLGLVGQVLIYPGLGGDRTAGSYLRHAHAPMLTLADVEFYAGIRFPGGIDPMTPDATAGALDDTDYAGLPATVCITAECDPLADDGRAYVHRITLAGGRAVLHEEHGLVHGYLRARHSVARARVSFARICGAISALAAGEWPVLPE
jgi:acetyl esterase